MGWWVLKHRRHEGPFTEEALHQELRKGRFRAEDYALSGDDLDGGRLEYVPLARVLQLKAPEAAPAEAPPPLVPVENSEARAASTAESTAAQIQASFSASPVNPASLAGFEAADFVPGPSKGTRARRTSSATSGGVSMTLSPVAGTSTAQATEPTPVAPPARNGLPRSVRRALVVAIVGAVAWLAFDKFKNGGPGGEVAGAKRPASTTSARPDIPTIVSKKPRFDSGSRSLRIPEMQDTRDREPMSTPGMMPMADLNSAPPPPDMLPPPQTEPAYNTGFAGPAGDPVPPPPPASEYEAPPAPPPPPSPDGVPGLPEAAE